MGIKDYKLGDPFNGPLLVKNTKKGKTTKGSPFIGLTLSDATGEVLANIWDSTPEIEQIVLPGTIIIVDGKIDEYQSKKQIKMNSYRPANKEDSVNMKDLLQMAPVDPNKMLTEIVDEIKSMKNETIKSIAFEILKNNADKFKTHPAAKNIHHNYYGGLAYHTYPMMKIGKAICELYPILNKDLLLAGIILHDIGKITEYESYTNPEQTLDGKLRGHISIISEEIAQTSKNLNLEETQEKLLLQHMVLSHHGLQSNGWGSAVSPQIIEAQVLFNIDTIDFQLDTYKKAISETEVHKWTAKIWGMDNREFYNHGL